MSGQGSLRWGIMGCARITRRGLIPGIRASRTGTLVGLASRDLSTARAWADEFSIPKVYDSYQALVEDPEIDAVYIPLPNELHRPWVLRAAEAHKHVLCEKPLALDATEAAELVDACRRQGVLLMEAFMWRHQPRTAELLKLVGSGVIGELRLIRSSFSFPIDLADWRLDKKRGGGALFDVGCYGVSTARFFAQGEPTRLSALAHLSAGGVDLSLSATLQFPGGTLAAIDCSFEQPFRCTYELVGSHGVIEVPDAYLPPEKGKPTALLRTSDPNGGAGKIETITFDASDQYGAMVDAFATSVTAGSLVAPAEDGLAQMAVLDRIKSAVAQKEVC